MDTPPQFTFTRVFLSDKTIPGSVSNDWKTLLPLPAQGGIFSCLCGDIFCCPQQSPEDKLRDIFMYYA